MHMHTHLYLLYCFSIHTCTGIHLYMVCLYTHTYVYRICVYTHMCMKIVTINVYIHLYLCVYTYMYPYINMYMVCVHMYIYIHIHIHNRICTYERIRPPTMAVRPHLLDDAVGQAISPIRPVLHTGSAQTQREHPFVFLKSLQRHSLRAVAVRPEWIVVASVPWAGVYLCYRFVGPTLIHVWLRDLCSLGRPL